jgi:hypothetical protein
VAAANLIYSRTSEESYSDFKEHFNKLMSKLLTDVPLTHIESRGRAVMEFRNTNGEPAVPLGGGFFLYLGQTLQAKREATHQFSLRTLGYAYRIAEGPRREDPYVIRWEYISREEQIALHPRHHCHLPLKLVCGKNKSKTYNLDKMHIPSGWVTIEEVLRYLFHELKVRPRVANWDKLLHESEETFKLRTKRSI